MSCNQWEEQIYLYLDGQLCAEQEQLLLAHIQQCESCARLFSEIEEINRLLKAETAVVDVPEDFSSRVMAALPDAPWKTKQTDEAQVVVPFAKQSRSKRRFTRWGTAVAAAVLVAAVGVGGLSEEGNMPPVVLPGNVSVADNQPSPNPQPSDENQSGETIDGQQAGNLPEPKPETPVTVADKPQQQPNNPVTPPKEDTQNVQTVSGSGELKLPQVAAGKEKTGIFSLLMLAACEDADVLNPVVVDGNTVEYYIRSAYGTSKWQSKVSTTEDPALVEENAKLGAAQGINTVTKAEWLTESAYTEAVSPLGDMTLLNSMAKDGGLWKITNSEDGEPKLLYQASGGKILSWSPDGTKAVYTDTEGNLYLVYPTEEVIMLVFEGNVSSVAWGADSKMIAFSATTPESIYSAVYSADLP